MLNAAEVNTILDALLGTLEARVPSLRPLSIETPQGVNSTGTYGSVILGALFTGNLAGKLTLTLEWVTAFQMAEELIHDKVDGFNEAAQRALEGIFYEAAQAMAEGFAANGKMVEIFPLPTLVDTSVLLSEEGRQRTVRVPVVTRSAGTLYLYLAFQADQKAGAEAA